LVAILPPRSRPIARRGALLSPSPPFSCLILVLIFLGFGFVPAPIGSIGMGTIRDIKTMPLTIRCLEVPTQTERQRERQRDGGWMDGWREIGSATHMRRWSEVREGGSE